MGTPILLGFSTSQQVYHAFESHTEWNPTFPQQSHQRKTFWLLWCEKCLFMCCEMSLFHICCCLHCNQLCLCRFISSMQEARIDILLKKNGQQWKQRKVYAKVCFSDVSPGLKKKTQATAQEPPSVSKEINNVSNCHLQRFWSQKSQYELKLSL